MRGSDAVYYCAIAGIAMEGDCTLLYGLFYAAARLSQVEAIVELALSCKRAHLGEIAGQFLFGDVHQAEFAHAGGVDDLAAAGEVEHLCEGGGVDALAAPATYVLSLQLPVGIQGIE